MGYGVHTGSLLYRSPGTGRTQVCRLHTDTCVEIRLWNEVWQFEEMTDDPVRRFKI